jgi:hypothetical protein
MLGKIVGCLNSRVRPKLLCTSRLTLQLAVTLILDHLLLGICLCLSSGNCATIFAGKCQRLLQWISKFKDSEADGRRKEAEFWWTNHHLVP